MIKRSVLLAIGILLSGNVGGASETEKMTLKVPSCLKAPKIDGCLEDPCWKEAYESSTFYDVSPKGETTGKQNHETRLRLTTDGNWLYVGVSCEHPTPQDMKVSVTENQGGRVFGDECVKIFLNPGMKDNEFFRYVLNCRNVNKLTRSFSADSPNLAWPSATKITEKGWNAEIAIPLFYMLGYGNLDAFRMNVFRKKLIKEYDPNKVVVGTEEFISSWGPVKGWVNFQSYPQLAGLKPSSPFPFVANAEAVTVGEMYEKDGKAMYDVLMTLKSLTDSPGTALVEVIEQTLDGKSRLVSKKFPLKGKEITQARVSVAIETLGDRKIDVIIRDDETKTPFQMVQIRDSSSFELLTCQTRFNYYTNETNAEILYNVGMSKSGLKEMALTVKKAKGEELVRMESPAPCGFLSLPLEKLENGHHSLKLSLIKSSGKTICEIDFPLEKLAPKPGHEWKIDRGAGGSLLHDGAPFFPFGFCSTASDKDLKEIADAGCNAFIYWNGKETDPKVVIERAKKYGLKVIFRPQMLQFVKYEPEKLSSLKKYLSGKDYKVATKRYLRRFLGIKTIHPKLTRPQRNEIIDELLELVTPQIQKNVRMMEPHPRVIGYKTLDEPHFQDADLDVVLRKLYLTVKKVDPYRPMFVLYSSRIPPEPKATSFADCLGTDPYWTPGRPLPRGSINWMSITTAKTVARARKDGMMPYTIPVSSLWSNTLKRMITPEEQICQTYLALIHNTRGIFYWTHSLIVHKKQWEAIKTLAPRIKELAPALTTPRPAQTIRYSPGVWAPLKDKVPDVQASLLRYPDGRHVLLAANIRRSAVEISVSVKGYSKNTMSDLFEDINLDVKNGLFTDTLSGRGVRSYLLEGISTNGEPVEITIKIKTLGEEGVTEPSYPIEGRVGMKNILPNPSFEETTHPDAPDYYWLMKSRFTESNGRIGEKGSCIGVTTQKPFHGEKCLFMKQPGQLFFKIKVQHDKEQPYVLSLYARTDSDKPVEVKLKPLGWVIDRSRRTLNIAGGNWKRYEIPMKAPVKMGRYPKLLFYPKTPGMVYLDALQIERGVAPSDFQP